ncbi:hypothetical protein AsAng_0013110 [Aureispira anguillae]|uniref:Septum formation initiator n=2 Tax=Aureispira anguillae TaxID=2864201 RepID=A0A915YCM8_9BACT|nr:hypothetical protein AsAng_0013110 [Aureispira anguillae]
MPSVHRYKQQTMNSNSIKSKKKLTPFYWFFTAFTFLLIWNAYDIATIIIQQNKTKEEIKDLKEENEILNEEIFQLQKEVQRNRQIIADKVLKLNI